MTSYLWQSARDAANGLLSVLLAPTCAACDTPLAQPVRGPVCDGCWRAIEPIAPPVCDGCGDPLPSWRVISVALARCPRCRRTAGAVDRSRAVGIYDGALRAILHALKYDGRRSLARPLARLMTDAGADLMAGVDVIVPVPLHRRRERARGFNQARDLAIGLGGPTVDALSRTRATPSQTDLPAGRRHANVRGAFAVRDAAAPRVMDRVVMLVDDVSTTGATLDACARALKRAGAREVRALTAARVATRRA